MTRKSQNLDQKLLEMGRKLLPQTGCSRLSIRQVTEAAGVNLGMFHYHFKNKELFIKTLLDQFYEELFQKLNTTLATAAAQQQSSLEKLRAAVTFMATVARDNRQLLSALVADSFNGEAVVLRFWQENTPRHIAVIHHLISEGQQRGEIVPLPVPQIFIFIAMSVGFPNIFGGIIERQFSDNRALLDIFQNTILTDEAIAQRLNLALKAIAQT